MKIYRNILFVIVAVIILLFLHFYFAKPLLSPSSPQEFENKVCFKENCFWVELAKTPSERERGLAARPQLGKDNGMLFIFDKEGNYSFWMKDTLIPLDMIWINNNGKIVFIKDNAQPCQGECQAINPGVDARYVLEINAGISKEIGLKSGGQATLGIK